MTVPFPHSPKPIQGRPFGENLHRGLHSCPCRGRKSPEIQEVTISRKALKIRHPQGCVGSTPTPGTCDSSDLRRRGDARSGRVSSNVSPITFATSPFAAPSIMPTPAAVRPCGARPPARAAPGPRPPLAEPARDGEAAVKHPAAERGDRPLERRQPVAVIAPRTRRAHPQAILPLPVALRTLRAVRRPRFASILRRSRRRPRRVHGAHRSTRALRLHGFAGGLARESPRGGDQGAEAAGTAPEPTPPPRAS